MNNHPEHLVLMVHVAPGRGRVICLDPSHREVMEMGAMHIAEWDNTEQIRKDFET